MSINYDDIFQWATDTTHNNIKIKKSNNIDNKNTYKTRQKYRYYEYSTIGSDPDYFSINPETFAMSTPYDSAIFKLSSLPFMRKR
jgi:hypothetical protein